MLVQVLEVPALMSPAMVALMLVTTPLMSPVSPAMMTLMLVTTPMVTLTTTLC
jgi:hypothetical protein